MSRPALGVHLRAFLDDPKGVAALVPTSSFTVDRMASTTEPERPELIVEYGPGSGVLTRALLERLHPDGRLVAIELNRGLAARLSFELDDPRLSVVEDSAERVTEILQELGLEGVDRVFSGIPFFWLPPERAQSIVASTHRALVAGGRFVAYQMFYQPRRCLRVHLDRCFSTVASELDLRNLPPYRIYQAVK